MKMMKRVLVGLLAVICVGGIAYAIYRNQNSCPIGRTEYYVFAEDEVKKLMNHFQLNPAFYHFKTEKAIEALQQGKIQVAYGEFFADGDYAGLIKSEAYRPCYFGVYSKKQDKDIKKIGYVFDFTLPSLKLNNKSAELVKYESVEQLIKDVHSGAIDAACVSDLISYKMDKGFSFKILKDIKKQLVFVFSKDTKLDIKAFNLKLKEVFSEKPLAKTAEVKKT